MAALFLFLALAAASVAAQAEQKITFITPESIPQCGDVNFRWSGGHSPFLVTLGTTDNASISSVTVAPNLGVRNYSWGPIDFPAGTPFTFNVRDDDGNKAESPVLTVQPSSNSSCLEETTPPSSASTESSATPTRIFTSSRGPFASQTATPKAASSSSNKSRVVLIASVVVGVLALLAIVFILVVLIQRRRGRQNHMSSKDALVRTFGSAKANLDSDAERDVEEAAIPDPYVFRGVSQSQSSQMVETEDLSRRPSSSRPDFTETTTARSTSGHSPVTPGTRNPKGERYLPNYGNSPQQMGSGAPGPSSGMHDEDIDRLAARMVAMMSAGRLGDQAWTPHSARDRDTEEVSSPPPMYKDVARRSGGHFGER